MELAEILYQYGALSAECVDEIKKNSTLEKLKASETLLQQGDMCDYFYFNRSGIMRVCHEEEGKEYTALFGSEGDIYTSLHSWFAGQVSPFSLISVEESEVFMVPYSAMRRVYSRFPEEMYAWTTRLCIEQLYALENRYLRSCHGTNEERLERFLLKNDSKSDILPGRKIAQRVPLKFIASYLGITQVTLSRIRRKISRSGEKQQ